MADKYLGESIPKLGFGFMRLPRTKDGFDKAQIDRMVDHFLGAGFTYFDTAFVYQGSEEAMRDSLVLRHPREKYQIATKLNLMLAQRYEDLQEQFDTSRARLGVDTIDFYLLHGLGGPSIAKAEELRAWDFVKDQKEKGRIRHYGLSFHGTPEELEDIFIKRPDAEFVQLQLNYLDWDNDKVQSRRVYEVARKYNKPVTVMEPIKGGLLGSEESVTAKDFKAYNPNVSVASWALRFIAQLDGLITVLSGMSTYAQLADNVSTFTGIQPLNETESALIKGAVEQLNSVPRVPCTDCRYCVPNCPQKILIPALMSLYSNYLVHNTAENFGHSYGFMTMHGGKAKDCIACKACEAHCPQHIEIADTLAKLSALVD
jgi:predicted aldo/keto reductase-like oxidoreductase